MDLVRNAGLWASLTELRKCGSGGLMAVLRVGASGLVRGKCLVLVVKLT